MCLNRRTAGLRGPILAALCVIALGCGDTGLVVRVVCPLAPTAQIDTLEVAVDGLAGGDGGAAAPRNTYPLSDDDSLDFTFARKPFVAMVRRTTDPSAQATGLPPNVLPWSPGATTVAICSLHTTAPMGRPPPRGLARVMTSGLTR